METLISWALDNGASFEAAPSAEQPRQLYAARDLLPGDVIFNIPEPLLLYGARAYSDSEYGPAFRQLQEELGTQLDQRSLLVLLLVLEKARGLHSFFAPYCDILPDSYDDPFWWSDAELQLLQGTRLHKAVAHYTNSLQQLHEWLLRLEQIHQQHLLQQQQQEQQEQQQQQGSTLATARGGWGLTYDAIKWSRSAVWSRAFTVKGLDIGSSNNVAGTAVRHTKEQVECDAQLPTAAPPAAGAARQGCGEGIAPVIALVPVLDMCDHHPQQRVSWRTVRQAQQHQQQHSTGQQDKCEEQQRGLQSFQMTSLSPVTKGSELFNNYGTTKPNEELLLGFGFVLDPNANDSFLVSISRPTPADTAAADGSNEIGSIADEAACDEAAIWQRRLAAVAALGLQLDVPITAAEPLPSKLLDLMLVAAAMPAWRLSTLLPVLPTGSPTVTATAPPAAAAGGVAAAVPPSVSGVQACEQPQQGSTAAQAGAGNAGGSPHQQQEQVQQQQQQQSLFPSAPLQEQLAALSLLQQQLTAKLQGMLPQQQLLCLAQQEEQQGLDLPAGLNPAHARLAAVYVLSQQQVLQAALKAVTQQAYKCLQQAVVHCAVADAPADLPAAATAAGDASDAAKPVPASSWHQQLHHCSSCGVLSVRPGADLPAGSVVLQAPLDCCAAAESTSDLVMQLMLLASGLWQQQQQPPPQQQQQQDEEQEVDAGGAAGSYFAHLWQEQQARTCAAAAQLLPWWLLPDNHELVGVLQDTPIGQQLLQASEELQDDFQSFLDSLQAAETDAEAAGSHSTSGSSDKQQHVLQLVRAQPQEAFRMFCWAQQLVRRGAVAVQPAAASSSSSSSEHEQQSKLLLVPGLEVLPKVLRDLVLAVSITDSTQAPQHNTNSLEPQQQKQQPSQASCSTQAQPIVSVVCSCPLPAGLKIHPAMLSTGSNAQQLLMDYGPQALCLAAAAEAHGSATSTGTAPEDGAAQQHLEVSSSRGNSTAVGSCCQQGVQHVYELTAVPPEEDPLRPQKLQLLAASVLGLCQYLTSELYNGRASTGLSVPAAAPAAALAQTDAAGGDVDSQPRETDVLLAMALCLLSADDAEHVQLLRPSVVHNVVQQLQQQMQTAGGPTAAAAAGVHVAGGAGVAAAASSLGTFQGETSAFAAADSAPALLDVSTVGGCPPTVPTAPSGAARRQLRQQILDATGREARKQLLAVLKADRKAIKSAQKQLQQVQQDHPTAAEAAACCCRTLLGELSSPQQAAAGVAEYLHGQLKVLDAWLELLQGGKGFDSKGGSSGEDRKKGKKKISAADGGSKKHKKAKHV